MSGASESAQGTRRARMGEALGWVALAMILAGALGRASVNADPFPHWDSDPMLAPSVKTGWGPTIRMGLDVIALLGCAVAVVSAAMRRARVQTRMFILLGLGGLGVVLHGYWLPADPLVPSGRGNLEDLIVGGTWLAALGGAVGLAHLSGRTRRLGLAIVLGFVVMLTAKGAAQRFVEHPMTIRDYDAQRESILAARGWRPDSPQALAYERRLRQNDASGWFGLSNVYATFGGVGLVAGLGLGLGALRRRDRLIAGLVLGGSACGLAMLLMSHSKGGMGAAGIGGAAALLLVSGRVRARAMMWTLALIPAGVLAIVVARGLLGERLGELSLLFRWHYTQGGVRMFMEYPLLGVGPSGFKAAYLLTRPPLGVEEVTSPHSVLLDWVSTLGVLGVAWCGLGLMLVMRAAGGGRESTEDSGRDTRREDSMILALACAGITAVGAITENAMATPEGAIFRVLGLFGWVGVASAMAHALKSSDGARWARAALVGGVGVIAAHSMIEVTPVWANSAALLGCVLGLCAASEGARVDRGPRGRVLVGVGVPVLGAMALGWALPGVARWEGALDTAAQEVRHAAQLRDRLGRIGMGVGLAGDSVDQVRAETAEALGEDLARSQGALIEQINRLSAMQGERAYETLKVAIETRPGHMPTARAAARLALGLAELAGADAEAWRARGVADAEGVCELRPGSASAWASLGAIRHAVWNATSDPSALQGARDAWARAIELDPLSLSMSVRLMDASDQLGEAGEAGRWARLALELDELKRLDPLKRLSDRERARCERLAAAGPGVDADPDAQGEAGDEPGASSGGAPGAEPGSGP